MSNKVRIGVVQGEPAWNDLEAGVQKTVSLIQDAAQKGIRILGFPELWIPGYPVSMWCEGLINNTALLSTYRQNSMARDSPEMRRICSAVQEANMFVVLGYSERAGRSFYMAQAFIGPDGKIANHRRKVKPTSAERCIWGDSGAEGLDIVTTTPWGQRVGALSCAEHMMPLMRMLEYTQGVQIHIASWPTCWESGRLGENNIEEAVAQDDILGRWATRFLAREGRCFAGVASQVLRPESYGKCHVAPGEQADKIRKAVGGGGHSMIFDGYGRALVKPLADDEEGILHCEVDLDEIIPAAALVDIVGNTARPDLVGLRVSRPLPLVTETSHTTLE